MRARLIGIIAAMSVGATLASASMIVYDNIGDFVPDGDTYYEASQVIDLGGGDVNSWVAEDFYAYDLAPEEVAEIDAIEWVAEYNNHGMFRSEIIYTAEVIILEESVERGYTEVAGFPIDGLSYEREGTEVGVAVVDRFTVELPETFIMTPESHYYVGVRLKTPDGMYGGSHRIASVGNPVNDHSLASAIYKSDWGYPDWTPMDSDPFWAGSGNTEYAISLRGTITPEPAGMLLILVGAGVLLGRRR